MALVRVAQYSSTPTVVGDYQAQNAHLQAFTNQLMTQQFILDSGTAQPVIKQGCYVSHGGSLYVADADTAITGSPADGSVYIRVSGTTSLTVEFVTDISGYAWNPVYTALTSGSYTLLPYLIVKASTVWTRYNFNPQNHNFGAIKATSVDTGSGAMTFNQGVKTTDDVVFNNITSNVHFFPTDSPLDYTYPLGPSLSAYLKRGVYLYISSTTPADLVITADGYTIDKSVYNILFSTGDNIDITNNSGSVNTVHFLQF